MTKEEVRQRLLDRIAEQINFTSSAEEVKDLSEAFKNVCDTEYDDSLLTELANMPPIEQTGACKQKCNGHCQNKSVDDSVFGLCD